MVIGEPERIEGESSISKDEKNNKHKNSSYFYAPVDALVISSYDAHLYVRNLKVKKPENYVKVLSPNRILTLKDFYFGKSKVDFSELNRLYFEYKGKLKSGYKEICFIKELFTGETFKISGPIESNVAKGYGNMSISGIKPISANNLLDFILSMSNNGCIDIYAEAVNNMFRENRDAFNDSKLIHEKLDGIVAEVRQRVFNHDIK